MERVYNFSAGPSMMPESVLKRLRERSDAAGLAIKSSFRLLKRIGFTTVSGTGQGNLSNWNLILKKHWKMLNLKLIL